MDPRFTPTTADLRRAATRTAALLRTVPDPGTRVPGLDWTVAETAAHLVAELRDYAGFAAGTAKARDVLDTLQLAAGAAPGEVNAAANARALTGFTDRDPLRLAEQLPDAVEEFASSVARLRPQEAVPVTNGLAMTVPVMIASLLGEQLVHGLDIARARRAPWRIERRDAQLVIEGVLAMAADYVDRRRTAGLHVSYELRFRGGPRHRFAVSDGTAHVTAAGEPVDCVINADPVAFLLVGYGRVGQWSQVLRGRLVAGGRRPWLGLRFGSLLTSV
ncbi:maleylpyruvate isomerase N-terminal domain-containing protein [Streptomyces sp. NPDC046197]|uniref:maleylpyruvate isomerase N-terminal domain-containing protein n=1 Tax=Streptomyces sp. NPDC046197 TaxID=3154337 RepID=UPI0033DDA9D6